MINTEHSDLWKAIINKASFEDIKRMIEEGADLNEIGTDDDFQGDYTFLELFYTCSVHPDCLELIKLFIENGYNYKKIARNGLNAVSNFAKYPDPRVFLYLYSLDQNLIFDTIEYNNSMLHNCIGDGSFEVFKFLLEKGADLKANYEIPLVAPAVFNEDIRFIKYLIEECKLPYKGNIYNNKDLLSIAATSTSNPEIIKYLVSKGFSIKSYNSEDEPVFFETVKNSQTEIIDCFLELGADINQTDKHGCNILVYAAMRAETPDVIKFLIDKGLSVNFNDFNGRSLAHFAAMNQNPEIMQILIDYGVAFDKEDNDYNTTPLEVAAQFGSPEVCELLIKAGSRINYKDKAGFSPIIFSTFNANIDVFNVLVKYGADVNVEDNKKRSLLYHAFEHSGLELVKEITRLTKTQFNNEDFEEYRQNIEKIRYMEERAANDPEFLNSLLAIGIDPRLPRDIKLPYVFLAAGNPDLRVIEFWGKNSSDLSLGSEFVDFFSYAIEKNPNPEIIDYLSNKRLFIKDAFLIFDHIIKNNSVEVWKRLFDLGFPREDVYLFALLGKIEHPNPDIVALLAEDEASYKSKWQTGSTACHMAAQKDDPVYIKILKEAGADINVKNDYGITPLMVACSRGTNIEVIDYLIENGANIKQLDHYGSDAFMYAMANSNINIIKHLVDLGADIHTKSGNGENILMAALEKGADLEKIKYILSLGIDINEKSKDGEQAISKATYSNPNLDVLDFLVKNGADLSFKANFDSGVNLLFYAAHNENEEIIEYLIKKGLDINSPSRAGETPLLAAARNPNINVFKKLIESGADINVKDNKDMDALGYAAAFNPNLQLIKFLLDKGFDFHKKRKNGRNAVFDATRNENIEVIKYLVSRGANLKEIDDYGCTTLVHALVYYDYDKKINENYLELAKYLIENGVDVNAKTIEGDTALMLAVAYVSDPEYIELLINSGADINAVNKRGIDCLKLAVSNITNVRIIDVIKLLINKGVSLNKIYDRGNTITHYAVENPISEIMQLLIDNGAPFDKEDLVYHNTPLDLAAWIGSPEICEILIKAGSRLEHRDIYGCTPLMQSLKNKNPKVFRMLCKAGANIKIRDYMKNSIIHHALANSTLDLVKEVVELTKTKFDNSNFENYMKRIYYFNYLSEHWNSMGLPWQRKENIKLPYILCAALNTDFRVLYYLKDKGCNIFAGNYEENVLAYALRRNPSPYMAELLIGKKLEKDTYDLVFDNICKNPSVEVWKKIFELGFPYEYQDRHGVSLLMKVLRENTNPNPDVIDLLSDEKTVNLKDSYGLTACHFAASKDDVVYLEILHSRGAKLNEKENVENTTPLSAACSKSTNPSVIDYLIKNGANINERSLNGNDALLYSINNSNPNIALYLIKEHKADIHTKNRFGSNILMEAIKAKSNDLIKAFVEIGIDVNEKDSQGYPSIIYSAFYNPNPQIIDYLVDKGADINYLNDKKENILIFAARNNPNENIIDYLLDKGFDKNYVTVNGETPILAAAQNPNFFVLEKLIERGANLEAVDNDKRNALFIASKCNDKPYIITYLIEKGIPVNYRDEFGNTAVIFAAQNNNVNIIKTLIEKGADIKTVNDMGTTALMSAVSDGNNCIEMVKYLIENGVDVNARNSANITALIIAASGVTDPRIIELLITAGADVNVEDDNGYTAYKIAKECNPNPAIAELIMKYSLMGKPNDSSFSSSTDMNIN